MTTRIQNFIAVALLLLLLWALLNQTLSLPVLAVGLFPIALILFLFRPFIGKLDVPPLWRPRSFGALLLFVVIFLYELVHSTIDVAWRVMRPSLPLRPAIVVIHLRLTQPGAKLLLANAITLTPGTLSMDLRGQELYIHWIDHGGHRDPAEAKKAIAERFENCLEAMYG